MLSGLHHSWCCDSTVISTHISPEIETMTVTCSPFYPQKEFTVLTAIYIPPDVNVGVKCTSQVCEQGITRWKKHQTGSIRVWTEQCPIPTWVCLTTSPRAWSQMINASEKCRVSQEDCENLAWDPLTLFSGRNQDLYRVTWGEDLKQPRCPRLSYIEQEVNNQTSNQQN